MARILSIVFIVMVLILVFSTMRRTIVTADAALVVVPHTAAVIEAFVPVTTTFVETGTLTFYPNNVQPVPYLFYQDENGTTVAKSLIFDALPPTDFSTWAGARVLVVGMPNLEHVVVSRIEFLSPP